MKSYKQLWILLLLCFFIACGEDKSEKITPKFNDTNILIEQDDEKSEVNDTNVPLPVQDDLSFELESKKLKSGAGYANL
ncbi:hypothetical protein [Campylobacter sp. MIT 97-5078]|uniref:hypothetical protein n=1 Tax=Campylobacter sp. MIT 97-5078 TaxID=1548153 RepID=UPI000514885F|nr:hypothetical protein [Campylobacter sp. MIT 97-5078]KGI56180.1 hypothetical protein LR59_08400 [Campylobacter sp. MIT 97-5078]TQR25534.1 hypothetical protein DMB91_07650 [Campylobacter sp. MIT 97-5078]